MGNCDGVPFIILAPLMPAWTHFKAGSENLPLGSGRPSEICILLMAERYELPVWGARSWSAR